MIVRLAITEVPDLTRDVRVLAADLHVLEERLRGGGGPRKIEKQHRDGKLTARERVAGLLDPGISRSLRSVC